MSKIKENFKHCIPSWIRRAPLVRERWDELLMMLEGHSGSVWSVAFSPDDKLLASGSLDTTARLWDHATGATLHTLKGHSKAVVTVAFSLDGNLLASGSVDKTIRLWNVATGALLQTLVGHVDAVHSVAFSSEKLIASGSRDKTIRLWDADTGAMIRLLKTNTGNTKSARSPVTFSPDGKMLASVLGDNSVGLLDPATGSILHTLEGNVKPIWALAFSPDGKLLASGSEDSIVRIWDAATGAPLRTVMSHVDVISEEYSKDGRILRYQAYPITNVAFSPDSKLIASSRTHDRTIRFSDATTGALLQKIGVLSSWVWTWAIAISQDGRLLASGAGDKIVRLWETAAGVPPLMREGHRDWVLTVAFSSDGKLLASGSKDGTIRLWEVATEAPLLALEGHLGQVVAVAFSPDSRLLASNSLEKNIKIWDIATGALLYTLKDQDSATVFSPSGKLLASRWDENKVMLWDAATKAALQEVTFDTFVSLLSFLADGSCIEICSPPDVDPLLSTQPEAAAVSHGIMIEDEWIRSAADRMLWLPPDYRPSSSAVHGSIVGLGHQSGHVSVLELDFSQYRDKH
jgi:WD40 repeat protein